MMKKTLAILFLAATLGCTTLGPNFKKPEVAMETQYRNNLTVWNAAPTSEVLSPWWEVANDPVLKSLIDQARENNQSLAASVARVKQARAFFHLAVSEKDLKAGAFASGSFIEESLTGVQTHFIRSAFGTAAPGQIDPISKIDRDYTLLQAGFDASWEWDLYGKMTRDKEAGMHILEASQAQLADAWLSLSAEIGKSYVQLRKTQALILKQNEILKDLQSILAINETLFDQGLGVKAQTISLQTQIQDVNRGLIELDTYSRIITEQLIVLTGGLQSDLVESLKQPAPVPSIIPLSEKPIPADLLRNRPDIRAAQHKLGAEIAKIGSEEANLYPRIQIHGQFGWSLTSGANFELGKSGFFSGGPALSIPIFGRKALHARVQAQEAKAEEAEALYRQRVLASITEVETKLADIEGSRNQLQTIAVKLKQEAESEAIAKGLFENGLADKQTWLKSRLLTEQTACTRLEEEARQSIAWISLYKAIGFSD